MHLSNSRANSTKMRERKLLWLPFSTSIIFIAMDRLKKIVSVVFSSSIQCSRFFESELTFQIFEIKNTHPAIAIICLVLLQVPKYFGCFKFLCARPKIHLHILCQSQTFCAKPKDDSLLVNALLVLAQNCLEQC